MICPSCKESIDWIKHTRGLPYTPKPGDTFVCVECGEVAVFDSSTELHLMTAAEFLRRSPDSQDRITEAVQSAANHRAKSPQEVSR